MSQLTLKRLYAIVLLLEVGASAVRGGDVGAVAGPPVNNTVIKRDLSSDVKNELGKSAAETQPLFEWFGRILNHHDWQPAQLSNAISETCGKNIRTYLQELRNGSSWAIKMNDASGRYNGQFFFGNDFWLGSKTLCWELENPDTNPVVPPFATHFFVVKVLLERTEITVERRQLTIGLCLPGSCAPTDVHSMVQQSIARSSSRSNSTSLQILNVRPVPGTYNFYNDVKFHIIWGTAVAAFALVLISTLYEWHLQRSKKLSNSSAHTAENNNTSYMKNHEHAISIINGIPDQQHIIKDGSSIKKHASDLASDLLLCFSALSNGKKILSMDRPAADAITCVHGLRFLSLGWVIMVHTYLQVFASASNKTMRKITERHFIYQTVSNATFSVDTFFFISGLLLTLLYFRADEKQKEINSSKAITSATEPENSLPRPVTTQSVLRRGSLKFITLVLHRFIRLTPAYLFVLGMNEVAIRWIVDSSVFDIVGVFDDVNCDKYWWRNALYINNLFPLSQMCMIWTWYMANDTQFYVCGIILLLVAVKSIKYAAGMLGAFLVTSWALTFSIAYYYDYEARIQEPFALFDELYDKPWSRIGPYLVGMTTGWILFKINCKLQMHRLLVVVGWSLSLLCLASLVYGIGSDGLKNPVSSIYVSLGHTAWGMSIAWITVACCTGYGGPVNAILSFRGMLPLSRLTYCAYLVHPIIMVITGYQKDGPVHLHNGIVFIITCGNAVASFLLSLCISLAFEAPAVRILQIFMGKKGKHD